MPLIVVVVIILTAILSASGQSISSVMLERKACHGTCPVYRIRINRNGDVKYIGDEFVKETGVRVAHIQPHQFDELAAKAKQMRFFELEDNYSSIKIGGWFVTHTDLPTTIVTVSGGGKTKRVRDYLGAPKGLYEFEQLIEGITSSERWTGRKDELQDAPYYDRFPLNRQTMFRGVLRRQWTGPLEKLAVTGYELELPKNNLAFTVHTEKSLELSKFAGSLVDEIGVLEDSNSFRVTSIHPVRQVFEDKKPWP